jgi:ferric-dicitrate binding protein FerR (iron transport regulator)
MEHENEKISRLLDYLSGELNEQEREATRQWIAADTSHRLLFEKVQRGELKLRWGIRATLIRGTYARVRHRLSRRRIIRWGRVAAVLLLGVAGVTYRLIPGSPSSFPVEEENLILPGKPRAMLYLASGEGVPVSDSMQTILDPNIAEINVKQGGELAYASGGGTLPFPAAIHRVIIPRGGEFSVVLTDGTKVWLNSRTELSYPVHFPATRREVFLSGEAYFDVKEEAGRPFVVHVGDITVNVLGTEFSINTQREGTVRTVLVTGSVRIASKNEQVTLKPNQLAVYRASDETFVVTEVEVTPHVAWKDDNFIFNNERIEDIMNTLSLWYDMDLFYQDEEVKEIRLTGDLERYEDVHKLLYFFEKTSGGVRFEIKGKTITIKNR